MTPSQRAIEAAARALSIFQFGHDEAWQDHLQMAGCCLTAALAVDGVALVDQREEQPSNLRLGDRVRVSMRRRKLMYETEPFWRGQIVGKTRDGNGWVVRRDLYKTPVAYHKSFCSKEGPAASDGESPPAGTEG